jgi:hypothetical protein
VGKLVGWANVYLNVAVLCSARGSPNKPFGLSVVPKARSRSLARRPPSTSPLRGYAQGERWVVGPGDGDSHSDSDSYSYSYSYSYATPQRILPAGA